MLARHIMLYFLTLSLCGSAAFANPELAAKLWGEVANDRPLFACYFYCTGNVERDVQRMKDLKDAVDFVQIQPDEYQVGVAEKAGMPWVGVHQMSVVLSEEQYHWIYGAMRDLGEKWRDHPLLVGWNASSEPRVSGGCGIPPDDITKLGLEGHTNRDFVAWLKERYQDDGPGVDSNGDGITLNGECGTSFASWFDVRGDAIKESPVLRDNAFKEWRETLVYRYTRTVMHAFRLGDPVHPAQPRLLNPWVPEHWGLNMNYYNLGDQVGVTLYTEDPKWPNPLGAGFEWARLGASIRVCIPWKTPLRGDNTGLCFGEFPLELPKAAKIEFSFGMTGCGEDGAAYRVFVNADGKVEKLFDVQHQGDRKRAAVDLTPFAGQKVVLRLENDPGAQKKYWGDHLSWHRPQLRCWETSVGEPKSIIDILSPEMFAKARIGYAMYTSTDPADRSLTPESVTGPTISGLDIAGAHVKMNIITNKARLAGKRVVLNETHPTANVATCTPEVLEQYFDLMLPYKPAALVFFACSWPDGGPFEEFDITPLKDELARYRKLFDETKPYRKIRRKADIAFIIPRRVGGAADAAKSLWQYGLDIYTLNDIDQARNYRKVVVCLDYADAEAERKLKEFLERGMGGRKVLILALGPELTAPVGRKLSPRVDRLLRDDLPCSPDGGKMIETTAEVLPGLSVTVGAAERVHVNAAWTERGPRLEPIRSSDGRIIGLRGRNLLCLGGWVDDLPALFEKFLHAKADPGNDAVRGDPD